MTDPDSVLVTGATGCVGPCVVRALHASGLQVRILARTAPPPGLLPAGVEVRFGDIRDGAAVESAVAGADAVIHMAAMLHVHEPRPGVSAECRSVNVDGTSAIVNAAIGARVRRIVYFSTIGVYDLPAGGGVISEDSPANPATRYARTKLEAEKIVLDASKTDPKISGTVLRCAAVYGSRLKGNYRRLRDALDRGRFIPLGEGLNRRTLIYEKDLARAALLAAAHPRAAGRVFNVSDGRFHTVKEIISAISKALGRNPPRLYLPLAPAAFLATALDLAGGLVGLRPGIRIRLDKYTEDVAVSSERIFRELGFTPEYDLYAGWTDAIAMMRDSRDRGPIFRQGTEK